MSYPEIIEIPSIPFGPEGSPRKADATYYREAARNIRYQAQRGNAFSGSNLTEAVAQLCDAAAEALERPGMAVFDESSQNGGRGPWCHHARCRHWFESECDGNCEQSPISQDSRP